MATWAIGDIQGCRIALERLLDRIRFDPSADHLWLVGDLVNRGPDSAGVLDLVISLGERVRTVLGNHDLHLLATAAGIRPLKKRSVLATLLAHPSREKYLNFLLKQPLIVDDPEIDVVMCHAGIYPFWSAAEAARYASEVAGILRGGESTAFLAHMYGNTPARWDPTLDGWPRLRFIINAFTRMRYCSPAGELEFDAKGRADLAPAGFLPWFDIPNPRLGRRRLIFGHWSDIGLICRPPFIGLDGGCVWGRQLAAVHLEPARVNIVTVDCG